ncbi:MULTISPECIES: LLM class flavin-dependent oxidoreductase [unclassified Thermoactinomyces]|uniref:LLM class flavin-dependent oxidoreductase n=1 Tax=unclassified Thermoactinomyces TaxID=2634588 RepID=UPI0018DDEB6F|nr:MULTISPECIES: LLM class flavin-dependent oxidoreductase [unclassified Thermoactinomyces]MBH8596937.1 LLM class flavin-dependent oxidoreductase [Thermoactinomyces sp. CICC 10523]MBH8603713.1 LLM class flavin-dependent oxidoreductase [Thermoactinomyces sp. CICC 10522]MBH8607651.1 LLM class flavin-dependent oxidoreductase [Thermoactinomyces sp. CICC 10521]
MIKLSVLDQSPIPEGKTAEEALADTARLAQETEKLGFHRFWVSEHHFTRSLAGSSPEVLISHLAAKTEKMRIGSGGVMLPHYSAYKVAENFKVLEALYPNRIDLGLGRAPGGMPLATKALQEGKISYADHYPQQIADLISFLHDHEHPEYPGLRATPLIGTAPEIWLLGSSGGSALLAAQQGAGYAFAQFINGEGGADVVRFYREHFRPSQLNQQPQTILAIFVVCAETDDEAEHLAASLDLSLLLIEKGGAANGIPSVETALRYPYSAYDRYRIKENRKRMIVGSKERVKERILQLGEEYGTEEFMIVTLMHDFASKLKSYRLLAEAFALKKDC